MFVIYYKNTKEYRVFYDFEVYTIHAIYDGIRTIISVLMQNSGIDQVQGAEF